MSAKTEGQKHFGMRRRDILLGTTTLAAASALVPSAHAQSAGTQPGPQPGPQPVTAAGGNKPNIIMIISDDFGYGDAGCYLGGEARGMPTPNIDRLAAEGMMFTSFYAQPSCSPGRAAMQTGRIPNRSGMTTVAFQGQGGGLPAAEWTLASVLKTGGYKTFFVGKWHLGEADYALPNAQGYDEMKYCGLYLPQRLHLRRPQLVPGYGPEAAGDVPEGHQGCAGG
jgi:arylsulfatase